MFEQYKKWIYLAVGAIAILYAAYAVVSTYSKPYPETPSIWNNQPATESDEEELPFDESATEKKKKPFLADRLFQWPQVKE